MNESTSRFRSLAIAGEIWFCFGVFRLSETLEILKRSRKNREMRQSSEKASRTRNIHWPRCGARVSRKVHSLASSVSEMYWSWSNKAAKQRPKYLGKSSELIVASSIIGNILVNFFSLTASLSCLCATWSPIEWRELKVCSEHHTRKAFLC